MYEFVDQIRHVIVSAVHQRMHGSVHCTSPLSYCILPSKAVRKLHRSSANFSDRRNVAPRPCACEWHIVTEALSTGATASCASLHVVCNLIARACLQVVCARCDERLHVACDLIARVCMQVVCARFDEEEYKAKRCPPEVFQERYGQYGIEQIWRDDILPCRTYLRHCTLAAQRLSPEACDSFLDCTFLGDRRTTIRQYLDANPAIMEELPPAELAERYCG